MMVPLDLRAAPPTSDASEPAADDPDQPPFEEGVEQAHASASDLPPREDEWQPLPRSTPSSSKVPNRSAKRGARDGLGRIVAGSVMTGIGTPLLISSTILLIEFPNIATGGIFMACAGFTTGGLALLATGIARRRSPWWASGVVAPVLVLGRGGYAGVALRF
jgi:hypothetical protein